MTERSVLVPLPAEQWGGLQTFAVNIAKSLQDAGWRWTVVVPQEAIDICQRLLDEGVEAICCPLPRFRRSPIESLRSAFHLFPAIHNLANLAQARNATLVQAVGAHHLHGLLLAKHIGKPLVWQLHSDILRQPLRRIMSRVITNNAHAVMTNGYSVARSFWDDIADIPNHFVFYAPVNTEKFKSNPEYRYQARRKLQIEGDTVVIGTVGNRVWQKNHRFLVEVAQELKSYYPKIIFLVLGGVHEPYQKTYEREVVQPANVLNSYMPGFFRFLDPGHDVAQWLQALDVFVLTSHAEGVPIALFEAMSMGKPVVSTNVGSISEVVEEGVTGKLCPAGNILEFCIALRAIVEDKGMRESMARAARARILQKFALSSVVQVHLDAYESAIYESKRSRMCSSKINCCLFL